MEDRQDGRRQLGREGEDAAARYLEKRGFLIIERGYRRLRGEIDIIARDRDTLVFVEVKTRTSPEHGLPEESVTRAKQYQIRKIAEAYLSDRRLGTPFCRFDVMAVDVDADGTMDIRHIPDAF